MPKLHFVEGNIGCGKTTLLRDIDEYLKTHNITNIEVIYEPVKQWQEMGLLDCFYKDIRRWSYTFQNIAFITKMMILDGLEKDKIYIVERSPMTDRNCFAELCYESGFMTEMEWNAYNMWYNHYTKSLNTRGFIYIHADPEICLGRIQNRNRGEETSIGLDYLLKLHDKHQLWLNDRQDTLYLDGLHDQDNTSELIENIIQWVSL